MLEAACRASLEFRTLLRDTLDRDGNQLGIIFYSDEIVPGNALGAHNFRKLLAMYWGIEGFRFPILSNEES
eukprot:3150294-Pyramimonas_sp.AAC.1